MQTFIRKNIFIRITTGTLADATTEVDHSIILRGELTF